MKMMNNNKEIIDERLNSWNFITSKRLKNSVKEYTAKLRGLSVLLSKNLKDIKGADQKYDRILRPSI